MIAVWTVTSSRKARVKRIVHQKLGLHPCFSLMDVGEGGTEAFANTVDGHYLNRERGDPRYLLMLKLFKWFSFQ